MEFDYDDHEPPIGPGEPGSGKIPRPRGWQRVVLFLLTFLGLNLLVGVGYIILRVAADPSLMSDPTGLARIREGDLIGLLLVLEPLTVLLVIFFRRFVDHASVRSLGVAVVPGWLGRAAVGAFHATLVMAVIAVALFATTPHITWTHEPVWSFMLRMLAYLALFAAVGFTEEIVVRGYVLRNLLLEVKAPVAVAASAAVFALLHAANPGFEMIALVNIFLVGVFLAQVALRQGSLWYPIGFHFAWNFILGFVLSLPVSGIPMEGAVVIDRNGRASIFSGGSFGPEGSAICTALLLILVLREWRSSGAHLPSIPPAGGARP